MRLIKPSFQIIKPTGYTIDDIYKSIELAGRVSYKSEDRITEDSAKKFVDMLMKRKHYSPLEFGTVYLKVPARKYRFLDNDYFDECDDIKDSFYSNPYTKIHSQEGYHYISTNYRVLLENFSKEFISELLQYLCEPTEFHKKRYTVKFTCSRSISHEFVRHRTFSFMQESQRYCNYYLEKFNSEITCIQPVWFTHDLTNESFINGNVGLLKNSPADGYTTNEEIFIRNLMYDEEWYMELLSNGLKPEEAREILPNATKTELFMCGTQSNWEHFLELRCAPNAHPQARELAIPLREEFIKNNFISNEEF